MLISHVTDVILYDTGYLQFNWHLYAFPTGHKATLIKSSSHTEPTLLGCQLSTCSRHTPDGYVEATEEGLVYPLSKPSRPGSAQHVLTNREVLDGKVAVEEHAAPPLSELSQLFLGLAVLLSHVEEHHGRLASLRLCHKSFRVYLTWNLS